jgi:two-component sensor histidine kinase
VFGPSKTDTSQDQQITNLNAWIQNLHVRAQTLEKNMAILVKNNNYFIEAIAALQAKDVQHDACDQEHDALIAGVKAMAYTVTETTAEQSTA